MAEKPDPTKEPEFQKVIRHFVTTPHKPHNKREPGKPDTRPSEPNVGLR
jgi:hypothetical protein